MQNTRSAIIKGIRPFQPPCLCLFNESASSPEIEGHRARECFKTDVCQDTESLLTRIDELTVSINELLVRIDEHASSLRKNDSGYSSCTHSPGEKNVER